MLHLELNFQDKFKQTGIIPAAVTLSQLLLDFGCTLDILTSIVLQFLWKNNLKHLQ